MSVFKVGDRLLELTYDLSLSDKGRNPLRQVWTPNWPLPGSLTPEEVEQYRIGRDALLNKVAQDTGGKVIIVGRDYEDQTGC
jgi:hypothetical protein